MLEKDQLLEVLEYASQVSVNSQALKLIKKLTSASPLCLVFEKQIPLDPDGSVNLAQLKPVYPLLVPCVAQWAFQNQLVHIGPEEIIKSFASDFHLEARADWLEKNAKVFGFDLRKTSEVNQFLVAHLAIGGQLGLEKKIGEVLCYPSEKDCRLTFGLRQGEMTEKSFGSFAVVHLSQVVWDLGKDPSLVEDLKKVHDSQPKVRALFQACEGQSIRAFTPNILPSHQ